MELFINKKRKINHETHPKSQTNPEHKVQCWRVPESELESYKDHHDKNNMILAQKKTCSPTGQVEDTKINPECYIHLIIYEGAKKYIKYIAEKINPAY